MRAIVYDRYGPPEVLRFEEVAQPVPSPGEVLVRVRAAGVNRSDCAWRTGDHPLIRVLSGVRRPKRRVLGSEFAGEVAALGAAGGRRVVAPVPRYSKDNILHLKELLESGRYRPVIDTVYPLDQVVEATRYVETHHKTGNVVLAIASDQVQRPPG
jgi:NADPH:quinone reductase-like Zn-dependent oxidoreductase